MTFKDWFNSKSYWLKGGLLLFILGFLIGLGSFVPSGTCTLLIESWHCGIFRAIIDPLNIIAGIGFGLVGGLFGALIGLIYGKFKNK